jgi:hypothetical protein
MFGGSDSPTEDIVDVSPHVECNGPRVHIKVRLHVLDFRDCGTQSGFAVAPTPVRSHKCPQRIGSSARLNAQVRWGPLSTSES